ncbi:MAG: sodium:solute symporter [Betaproteobacteria bacterium RIFCSPLOWO2_02_FULL_68_150]|nr:MAG: sodium:solute symporter [Betaproteobacteria bacterium RIFCSPLOWO2_02_FULL_68_150]
MLVASVVIYLGVTIAIGLWAARRVHNSKDYLIAGRSLPLYMSVATVFATWFGAETVLSVSATFAKDGLSGIVADPFGSSFCLFFVALFFARAFYRMDLLTIGDFYRKRYGKPVEVATSIAITASYLGWTSAQLTALGLAFSVLSGGAMSLSEGIVLGAAIVLGYTIWGGMWSVAWTDLFQTVIIVLGLWSIAWLVGDMAGGAAKVVSAAYEAGRLEFWPKGGAREWLAFFAAWITLAVGSIPQQDVFQRVTSARDESTAVKGSLIGGAAYFVFAFVPIYIAYAALMIDPSLKQLFQAEDSREIQRILPELILNRTPLWAQIVFFGALLSAILSTASGAILAPTGLFTENVLRPFVPHMSDRQFLLTLRIVLVTFALAALLFALNSRSTMYEMVQSAYKVTLVGAFVPLAAGLLWKRANAAGAVTSILLGLVSWLLMETFGTDSVWPPQLVGLACALLGMFAGSIATPPSHPAHQHPAPPHPVQSGQA